MAFVVKNDLQRFADKLKNYKAKGDLAEKVAEKVTNKGVEIAQKNWGGGVSIEVRDNKLTKSIVVIDEDKEHPTIAYREFGTGIKGKGTYEGNLPDKPITFTTKYNGEDTSVTVLEWVYNYRKDHLHWTEQDWQGMVAQMPMFNTAKELREYIKTELAKDIRKGD